MSDGGRPLELASMRVSYELDALDESRLEATWYDQLRRWLADATQAGIAEPNAMVLATADSAGRPSSRAVLCKGLDSRGVVFFTHYDSPKSRDLLATGLASATFPWFPIQRQANLRGTAEKVSKAEATAYWATRPRGSQLGAWASARSQEVAGRAALDAAFADAERQFGDVDRIPAPENWGGWRIRPQSVEFWQGRPNRMHDRLVFERLDGDWRLRRLAP
jgi:pyridoxamine 5'-phosphate oxidase